MSRLGARSSPPPPALYVREVITTVTTVYPAGSKVPVAYELDG
jgi:hypothetical protein